MLPIPHVLTFRVPHWITVVLPVLQGLLTPVIGGIAVYIAWQQWKTNERKLVLDRYDRRLRVYQEVLGILTLIFSNFKPEVVDLQKFRAATAEADFLFEPEISAYLDEIVRRGMLLWSANSDYRDFTQAPPPGYDHQMVVEEMSLQKKWFVEQRLTGALQKFKKYLDVSR
jgi:hypothetical protein